MTEVHVISDERTTWRVYDRDEKAPLSEHTSATEAEMAAQALVRDRDADRVVVHDRYNRTHEAAPLPAGVSARLMDADRARAIAEALHHGQRDAGGASLIDHVRRVARTVAPEARVVAWLHEALEHTSIPEETLLTQGLSTDELRAIRLVTHDNIARSNTAYLAHIEMLARAGGAGADLARSVKCADLADRMRNPAIRPDGWSPPYERGLQILQRAASRRRTNLALVRGGGSS